MWTERPQKLPWTPPTICALRREESYATGAAFVAALRAIKTADTVRTVRKSSGFGCSSSF
jgi:hypothetical protein